MAASFVTETVTNTTKIEYRWIIPGIRYELGTAISSFLRTEEWSSPFNSREWSSAFSFNISACCESGHFNHSLFIFIKLFGGNKDSFELNFQPYGLG
jgi:hypothetical protein